MSVHKRTYRPFTGELTSPTTRFGVLVRYSLADVWSSKITTVLFFGCMAPSLIALAVIYIMSSPAVKLLLTGAGGPSASFNLDINERFFFGFLQAHCWMALALTAWIGPKLMSVDFSNNALPTILSHPISRVEYVLAKIAVIAVFLSAVTWVPLMLLFAAQAYLSATPWLGAHWHIGSGIMAGCLIWIALLSLIALALASWVKWRIVTTGLIFAAIFIPAGMGSVFSAIMRTNWGEIVNIPVIMYTLWHRLLRVPMLHFAARNELPTWAIVLALAGMCAGCVTALNARVRAREVVRG